MGLDFTIFPPRFEGGRVGSVGSLLFRTHSQQRARAGNKRQAREWLATRARSHLALLQQCYHKSHRTNGNLAMSPNTPDFPLRGYASEIGVRYAGKGFLCLRRKTDRRVRAEGSR